MAAPYQVITSTATTALSYSPQQRIATLCDGSQLVANYDGSTSVKLTQITNPSSGSPTMTLLAQALSISGSGNTVASLYVLHNGTTSDDVWVVYSDNSGNTATLYVAHATYTASGSSWSWDNTGTSLALGSFNQGFMIASVVWTGTNLIVACRANTVNYGIAVTYTTTKSGASGWAALAWLDGGNLGSHCYPMVLHDATNGCTLCVYSLANDTIYARVIADGTTPSVANWSSAATISGTINVNGAILTATLDTTNKKLFVAWVDAAASPNPHYVVSAYTTSAITPGSTISVTGGGGTGATGPSIGLDVASPPNAYLFWASAAAGAASDVSYVTIASPYASGNVSSVTNLTAASANDNVYPHVPQQDAMSGYVPLVYLRSHTSAYPVEFDNTITASSGGTPRSLAGESDGIATASAALTLTAGLAGESDGVSTALLALTHSVPLAGESDGVATASAILNSPLPGTGIGNLAVTTQSQSWSGGPGGSPGTETDVTYTDALGGGWSVGLIPTYGGAGISSWYEVDAATAGANQTSLTTSTPDGHIHWLEQNGVGAFAGSEDLPFTLTEQAPTGTAFRRYYKASFGPDANGFHWNVYACIYPGDPGLIAYRFDCINSGGSAIALAGTDGMEIALIGGLQQSDATWAPANGFYGDVGGSPTTGWPSGLTNDDPDYVGIAPASGHGVSVGVATIKQARVTAFTPAWANPQIQYLQNASRLKLKVQGDLSSFGAGVTSTVYLLNVLRRALTAADTAALAADYLAPGTPTMTAGSFTTFSYDERAYVFAAAGNALGATLDLSPAHVTVRYKPVLKVTGWTGGTPQLTWGGSPLVAGVHYRHLEDVTNSVLYIQIYFDVVASGATAGQRNNAALGISPNWSGESDGVATALLALSIAQPLAGESDGVAVASAALTVGHTLAGESDGVATASATLTHSVPLTGESDGVASATLALALAQPLAGESDGVATASAILTHSVPLAGASNGVSSASATLTHSVPLAGASNGVATADASLAPGAGFSGESDGVSTASATLTVAQSFVGVASGVSTASASLTLGHTLSGESDGVATASAILTHSVALAGESDGVATAGATLTTGFGLSGESDGVATASATLITSHTLAAESDGVSTASAALPTSHTLAGTALAMSTASAALIVGHALSGVAAGAATALLALSQSVVLAGEADGVATALALLLHSVALAGESDGVATALAALAPVHPLVSPSGVSVTLASGAGIPSGVSVTLN